MSESDRPQPELAKVVHRNIQALLKYRCALERKMSLGERAAARISVRIGRTSFVVFQLAAVLGWILLNSLILPEPFDPFPFPILTMIASVEAISLSTFVLIAQNRVAKLDERRTELDLQIGLLSEHEITRLISMVDAIAKKLGVEDGQEEETEELKKEVTPENVLKAVDEARL